MVSYSEYRGRRDSVASVFSPLPFPYYSSLCHVVLRRRKDQETLLGRPLVRNADLKPERVGLPAVLELRDARTPESVPNDQLTETHFREGKAGQRGGLGATPCGCFCCMFRRSGVGGNLPPSAKGNSKVVHKCTSC